MNLSIEPRGNKQARIACYLETRCATTVYGELAKGNKTIYTASCRGRQDEYGVCVFSISSLSIFLYISYLNYLCY